MNATEPNFVIRYNCQICRKYVESVENCVIWNNFPNSWRELIIMEICKETCPESKFKNWYWSIISIFVFNLDALFYELKLSRPNYGIHKKPVFLRSKLFWVSAVEEWNFHNFKKSLKKMDRCMIHEILYTIIFIPSSPKKSH